MVVVGPRSTISRWSEACVNHGRARRDPDMGDHRAAVLQGQQRPSTRSSPSWIARSRASRSRRFPAASIVVVGTKRQQDKVQVLPQSSTPSRGRGRRTSAPTSSSNATPPTWPESRTAVWRPSQRVARTPGTGAQGVTSTLDFTVVAEERTNSLIVTGTAEVQGRLAELIAQASTSRSRRSTSRCASRRSRSVSAVDLGITGRPASATSRPTCSGAGSASSSTAPR